MLFPAYSTDAVWALLESLPVAEIGLTLAAVFTVIVLGQQLADLLPARPFFYRKGRP